MRRCCRNSRGAAPIQAAIAGGLDETGVTIMRMVPALDAGPVMHTLTTPIFADETGGELTLRLSELGATALLEALALMEFGEAAEHPQDDAQGHVCGQDRTGACSASTGRPRRRLWRAAFEPMTRSPARGVCWAAPRSACLAHGRSPTAPGAPGEVLETDELGVIIACGEGAVAIREVHPAGKRRMAALDWAQGTGCRVGDVFSRR